MDSAGGNIHAGAGEVGAGFVVLGEGHFAVEDDVGGKRGMGVVGVEGARRVLPGVDVGEALGAEEEAAGVLVHGDILTTDAHGLTRID